MQIKNKYMKKYVHKMSSKKKTKINMKIYNIEFYELLIKKSLS